MDEFYNEVKKFWDTRSEKDNFLWRNELLPFKVEFIKKNIKPNTHILDLGAGDLSLDFELVDNVTSIVAVDYASVVQKHHHDKITSHQQDVYNFISNSNEKYDHILVIGVMNFIKNPIEFYQACKDHLLDDGSLIVAHQCGKYNQVIVNNFIDSEPYTAIYPYWLNEQNILESLNFKVTTTNPYPDKFNHHDNTEFKGFICKI